MRKLLFVVLTNENNKSEWSLFLKKVLPKQWWKLNLQAFHVVTLLPVSRVLLFDQVLGYEARNDSTNITNTCLLFMQNLMGNLCWMKMLVNEWQKRKKKTCQRWQKWCLCISQRAWGVVLVFTVDPFSSCLLEWPKGSTLDLLIVQNFCTIHY